MPTFNQPNQNETKFLLSVMHSQKIKPQVDWKKVALLMGLKDAKSANTRYGIIMRRLGWDETSNQCKPRAIDRVKKERGKAGAKTKQMKTQPEEGKSSEPEEERTEI
ncbi:MAG: hypothetical protein M1833_003337 [Piccolia ochrophora]|nr:MAG: hypothetical protein M1833_003337 [Piccolia ochrophora]